MITKIPASSRYHASHSWLSTYHLFSFADYYDPANMNFGTLRVFNDDTIDAHSGFGAHSHQNMEIITIVLEGELTHKDSMGNEGSIGKGEVQYMSAGTGVTHAELNNGDVPVHLYQIWILSQEKNLPPVYAQRNFSALSDKNILLPVISSTKRDGALIIRTDAIIYTSTLEEGRSLSYEVKKMRGAFLYITSGSLTVNGNSYEAGDQARIEGIESIELYATKEARFLVLDLPLV
jgi:redox-sensitive bicupin YhaK (pirin superfamily)